MIRLEYVNPAENSNKFYELTLAGRSVTVRWGRIGSIGQTKTYDFPMEWQANSKYQELRSSKLAKGYRQVLEMIESRDSIPILDQLHKAETPIIIPKDKTPKPVPKVPSNDRLTNLLDELDEN